LEDLTNRPGINVETKSEAVSLANNIKKFEFIVMSGFWYKVLSQIDRVNKLLQKEDITVDMSVRHIHGLINLLQSVRETNCTDAT
jgi:ACT domain-containing protein